MKRVGKVRSINGAVAVVLALTIAGCGAKEIPREDWGAITPDSRLRVTTLDGTEHELTRVRAYTDALRGQEVGTEADVRIPLDSVEVVETARSGAAAPVLTAIAVAAATIWIIQASGESDEAPPPTPVPTGSCPFIYSFDGETYHLDSETYAGAVLQALERTDLDNLEHIRPVDGRYRIRLSNERPESQYTDALTLRVVDHPRGTQVYTDVTGEPRVLDEPRPPRQAVALRGADVLRDVAYLDGNFWEADPVIGIDTADPSSFRDGMELTFPRPADRDALLAVRSRNTALAPFVLETFLGLLGDDLTDWYRRVEREPDLQGRLRSWIAREGTLHVSVWIDGAWQRQDHLLDVGPHLAKTQVARLDLSEVEGDEVRVRLEGPRGLWTIDQVVLGSESESQPSVHDLMPAEATGPGERDLREVLASSDGRYLTALPGDEVEMTFLAPEDPPEGMERSVMARTSGFYHIYVESSGPARLDVVERILDEPLFVNRYMLATFLGTELEN